MTAAVVIPVDVERPRSRLLEVLGVAAIFGSTLLQPPFVLPLHATAVDIVFLAVLFVGWQLLFRPGSDAEHGLRRLAPWLWLYVFGQLLGLLGAGLTSWGLTMLGRNVLPVFVFLVLLGLLEGRRRDQVLLARAYVLTGLFQVVMLIASSKSRATGTFGNPNYPAHLLLCAVVLVTYVQWRRVVCIAILVLFAIGLRLTGSFSTFPFLAAVLGYWIWVTLGRFERSARILVRGVAVAGIVVVALLSSPRISSDDANLGNGFTTARLDQSSNTRYQLWSDGLRIWSHHPLGIGPDGLRNRDFANELPPGGATEIHNDTLDTLVSGGVVELVGLIGIVVVVWRLAPRASASRALLLGLIIDSIFRQTWNFRHMWLALAVAIAFDRERLRSSPPGRLKTHTASTRSIEQAPR